MKSLFIFIAGALIALAASDQEIYQPALRAVQSDLDTAEDRTIKAETHANLLSDQLAESRNAAKGSEIQLNLLTVQLAQVKTAYAADLKRLNRQIEDQTAQQTALKLPISLAVQPGTPMPLTIPNAAQIDPHAAQKQRLAAIPREIEAIQSREASLQREWNGWSASVHHRATTDLPVQITDCETKISDLTKEADDLNFEINR